MLYKFYTVCVDLTLILYSLKISFIRGTILKLNIINIRYTLLLNKTNLYNEKTY